MNDIGVIALGVFAAIAPFGAMRPINGYVKYTPLIWLSGVIAITVLAVAALLSESFLEFLDISPENFQFAAGAVMAPFALRLLWTGDSMPLPENPRFSPLEPWLFPAGVPLLAGPTSMSAVMSYSARFGVGDVAAATIPVIAVSTLLLAFSAPLCRALGYTGADALGRLSGALLVIIAVELAVDGVKSV